MSAALKMVPVEKQSSEGIFQEVPFLPLRASIERLSNKAERTGTRAALFEGLFELSRREARIEREMQVLRAENAQLEAMLDWACSFIGYSL